MKKIIIIVLVAGALTTAGILIGKHLKKQKALNAPAALPDRKQAIMQEIINITADLKSMDVAITKERLMKLTEGELASLKIAFMDLKDSGRESAMSPANQKVLKDLAVKMFTGR